MTKDNDNTHRALMIASGATLLIAGGLAYYLYGTDEGPKRRRQLKGWMMRVKEDVVKEIDKLKDLNEEAYKDTLKEIKGRYERLVKLDPAEIGILALRMKRHWTEMKEDIDKAITNGSVTVSVRTKKPSSRRKKSNS